MAEKRITTVDEIMTMDADADYVLVSRGVQQDLRRILLRRLPAGFDIHDDIIDELTSLAGVDRLAVSDEGSPGSPQKFVKLSVLRSFLLDLFDLHDDVPTELTSAAHNDRLLISDESEAGDPQKFITFQNFANSLQALQYEKLTDEMEIPTTGPVTINHTLGRAPVGFEVRLICKTAEFGYQVGDEVYTKSWSRSTGGGVNSIVAIYDVDDTSLVAEVFWTTNGIILPRKDNNNTGVLVVNRWRVGLTVWG